MWNPFKAVASGIAKAGKAIANVAKAPFTRREKAPKTPPAPARPPAAAPAPKQGTRVMPTIHAPAPPAPPKKERKLPPSMIRGTPRSGESRDESILGTDSDQERTLHEAVKEFEAEHYHTGLNKAARDLIDHPSFAAIFDRYSTGSGFSTEQWIGGMNNIRNLRIARSGSGVKVLFDADFEIDDYDLGSRSVSASF